MTSPRIALAAMTTKGAAGDYVGALGTALAGRCTTALFVPSVPSIDSTADVHLIDKPSSRLAVAGREALAWVRPGAVTDAVLAWKPDVVHIAFGEGYPSAAQLAKAAGAAGVPVVATWHDPQPHGQAADWVQHNVALRTIRTVAGVHVHCDSLLPPDFATPVLVAEHPAFPCPSCSQQRTTTPLRVNGSIVAVGRFAPYKGFDPLCEALAECWRRGTTRTLVVIGQGRVPKSLARLREEWPSLVSIEDAYVSTERLHDVLGAAAVCVMPYLSGTQSALPWLARAHGLHLVASDVGCIGDVTRRIGGTVVRPGSVPDLVDALLEPPGHWRDIGRLPMPTFDELADRLLGWYPTLSAS